jgi:DNA polymerase
MERDALGDIRRYLLGRRSAGADVAYRIAGAERPAGEPRPAERGIVLVTSPAPPVETPRRIDAAPRSESAAVEQASLFGDPVRKQAFDLSGFDLAALETAVSKCERCGLAGGRTRTVFGSGDPASRIVFIGEAPGRDEDLQGLPFVGRAGQLLTKMLAAIGFARDEVYITNILKCRPPNNREPQEDEMTACEPYLTRQLAIMRPVLICALGRIAAHGLLKKTTALGALRQGVHYYHDIPVAVTYHPAALLRNPNLKRDAWEDLQAMRRLYDERAGEDE